MINAEERQLSNQQLRILSLAAIGGTLEFYDFIIFVFFADVLGKLFFATNVPEWARQAQTLGIFSAGYLVRPLGGIVMAHVGDKQGRKRIFILTILLMAVPTDWVSSNVQVDRSSGAVNSAVLTHLARAGDRR